MLLKKLWQSGMMTACLVMASQFAQAEEPAPVGVIRISDRISSPAKTPSNIQQSSHVRYRAVPADSLMNSPFHLAGQHVERSSAFGGGAGCATCRDGRYSSWDRWNLMKSRLARRHRAYWKCKLGYFIPTGCGGGGCPPFGMYDIAYPVNPQYFDGRDGRLFSAQGYGVPMAVPLAPNVRHTYNYGWGIPSSRRTPISNPAPHIQYLNP
ncbi:MAG: hypothetical protein Tsb009_22590 [Planctomycetaceae bacterium]